MGKTEFLKSDDAGIARAAEILKASGVVAIPTETVYGLGAIARDETAVLKIFKAKERPLMDPLIAHIPNTWHTLEDLQDQGLINAAKLSRVAKDRIQLLMAAFWPGPLTLVLPRGPRVPDLVTSALETVGVRMPDHALTQKLLCELKEAVAAPSANRFGRVSPTTAEHVQAELNGRIDAVLDGGACSVGVESTILYIDPLTSAVRCLRPGGIALEDIEKVIDDRVERGAAGTATVSNPNAPGMLPDHYSPATPLLLLPREDLLKGLENGFEGLPSVRQLAILFLHGPAIQAKRPEIHAVKTLSQENNFETVARNLFSTLRELDALGVDLILAEKCEEQSGLGFAVGDRLKRAEHKRLRRIGGSA